MNKKSRISSGSGSLFVTSTNHGVDKIFQRQQPEFEQPLPEFYKLPKMSLKLSTITERPFKKIILNTFSNEITNSLSTRYICVTYKSINSEGKNGLIQSEAEATDENNTNMPANAG